MNKKIPKRKMELPAHDETYFIYLKNPLEYRRQLLESTRRTIHCLKNYQRILLIRQKKLEELQKLKTSLKELLYLNKKLNEKLPKYDKSFLEGMKSEDKVKPARATPINARKPAVPVPHRERSELDKLEESLAGIEKKLRTLQ
jgi:hypothetical protein